jgi:hypothetical protein
VAVAAHRTDSVRCAASRRHATTGVRWPAHPEFKDYLRRTLLTVDPAALERSSLRSTS